jgi:hypothetical protein
MGAKHFKRTNEEETTIYLHEVLVGNMYVAMKGCQTDA